MIELNQLRQQNKQLQEKLKKGGVVKVESSESPAEPAGKRLKMVLAEKDQAMKERDDLQVENARYHIFYASCLQT